MDLATLTGAVSVALGDIYVAIMGNDQPWIDDVITAGKAAGEKIWQLPLDREYREQIKVKLLISRTLVGARRGQLRRLTFCESSWMTRRGHIWISGSNIGESQLPGRWPDRGLCADSCKSGRLSGGKIAKIEVDGGSLCRAGRSALSDTK